MFFITSEVDPCVSISVWLSFVGSGTKLGHDAKGP